MHAHKVEERRSTMFWMILFMKSNIFQLTYAAFPDRVATKNMTMEKKRGMKNLMMKKEVAKYGK